MPEPTSRFEQARAEPGDIVISRSQRGVVSKVGPEHPDVDWSGNTVPRAGAKTWILST